MRTHGVHDGRRHLVPLEQVRPDHRVRALDLVVDGLADVVEQPRQLGDSDVGADLGRHHRGEIADLLGMVQHLLPVAGAETQDAEVADDLRVQTLQAELQDRALPFLFDPLQDLLAGFGYDLLDAGRMDPAIHDQLVERDPGHLTADRVEPADDHGLRGVVDDQVDPGGLLEGADVAPFFADNAALQLVGRQRQHRDRDLGGLVGGDALDGLGDDLASSTLALVPGRKLRLPDLACDLVAQILFDLRHQDALCLLPGHVGDTLELELLLAIALLELAFGVVERLLLVGELALGAVEVLAFAVEVLLFLKKALFDLLRLGSVFASLLLGGGTDLDGLFLGLEKLLFGLGFGVRDGLLGLELKGLMPVALAATDDQVRDQGANQEGHRSHHHQCQDENETSHVACTSCIRLSKCVTMAGRDGPTSGWLYDLRASNRACVTLILGPEAGRTARVGPQAPEPPYTAVRADRGPTGFRRGAGRALGAQQGLLRACPDGVTGRPRD